MYFEALLELISPVSLAFSLFAYAAGVIIARGDPSAGGILPIGFAVVFLSAFDSIINQLARFEADRKTAPDKPIASGIVSREAAVLWAVVFGASGCLTAYTAGGWLFGLYLVGAVLILLRTFVFDGRVLLAGEVTGGLLAAGILLLGAAAGGGWLRGLIPFLLGVVFVTGMRILDSVGSRSADRSPGGKRTVARVFGRYRAVSVAIYTLLAVVPLSFIPYFFRIYSGGYLQLAFLVNIVIVIAILALDRDMSAKNATRISYLLKIALVPGIIAFLV